MSEPRDEKFQLRLSKSEFDLLKQAAELSGVTMSELIRLTVISGCKAILAGDEARYRRVVSSTGSLIFSSMAIKKDT